MSEVNMPKLSDTMEEGTIVEWKKSSGDEVHKGDVLAEVESDKATFDLEAESDGTLEIIVEKGVPAKIGAAIARIGAGGAAKPAEKKAPPPKAEPKQEAKPKPETVAERAADNQASEPAPRTRRGAAAPTAPRRGEDGETGGAINASPLA